MADPAFRAQFGLDRLGGAADRRSIRLRDAEPDSRLDAFFVAERTGCGSPSTTPRRRRAPATTTRSTEVFYGLPVMREFLRQYDVRPLPARHGVLHALLDAYEQWRGRARRRRASPSSTGARCRRYSEFVLFQDYFKRQGIECVIVDPREVEYRRRQAPRPATSTITLIYKRVLISELVERGGHGPPGRARRARRAVCMVNPFRCKLLHKKASLAVLSDERNAACSAPTSGAPIAAHIPWTRRGRGAHDASSTASRSTCPVRRSANREQLVLKPNDDYGGEGIVLGWDGGRRGVGGGGRRRRSTEPYVVQERIALPSEPYPSAGRRAGRCSTDRMLTPAPSSAHGESVDGCLTRISTGAL